MKLIAKKPCSFGGEKFYIGDEIPESLVTDAGRQEKLGVISIVNDAFFTQEQVGEMVDVNPEIYDGKINITVMGEADGENVQASIIPATPEEIGQVFIIMQMNAEEGTKAIAEVTSENVLILLHAADSRKGIKTAAKKQVDVLFADVDSGKAEGSNKDAGNTEGDDA